jgi:hypothetical protein
MLAMMMLGVAGCSPGARVADDDGKPIVRAVLDFLVKARTPICIDASTRGHALRLWRDVVDSPQPVRDGLGWQPAIPLAPPSVLTARDLARIELKGAEKTLVRPDDDEPAIPRDEATALTTAARALTVPLVQNGDVDIREGDVPAGVQVRWWAMNRVRSDCPVYLLSNPAVNRDTAFVMVKTDHWGTVLALRHVAQRWSVIAQWSPWLY